MLVFFSFSNSINNLSSLYNNFISSHFCFIFEKNSISFVVSVAYLSVINIIIFSFVFIKISKLLLIIALFIIAIPKVDAARVLCSTANYSDMKAKAYKTNFSYELKFTEDGSHYFKIYMTNLQEGIELHFNDVTYSYEPSKKYITLIPDFDGGKTYTFNLYASSGYPCVGELLYTKRFQIPKYNTYSTSEACIEYEEFPLCNKWYQGDIPNYNYFLEKLNEYKKSLEQQEEKIEEPKKEKNIFEKIIDFYMSNIVITGPITVLIVGTTTFIIVRNLYI